MSPSCSQSWQAPIYFTLSAAVLAFMAISTAMHHTNTATPVTNPTTYQLSLNASRALRRSGFNIIATLLQVSPEIFMSSPNSTIFAIKDSAISKTSFPPWLSKDLLQYHTSPLKLSMNDLLKKPQGSCFPTLLNGQKIAITKIGAKKRLLEINHVLVSHPDMILEGPLSIHGVLRPFSSFNAQDSLQGWNYMQSPICDSNCRLVSDSNESKNVVEWSRIIRLLSSNGFVSFAIGLHSVLGGILEDHMNLNSTTIFAPLEFLFVASPSPLLDRIVRFHILPQRFTYKELDSLPDKALLRTIVAHQYLEITAGVNSTQGLCVNGEQIIAPDIFWSKKFVIHGISQALGDGRAS
ncbi:fasciclin-like arabinogalactan protein 21 [Pistacia vera]|uniref:fasciclin-like arabinogalactan protein 21 n=1 Tax=Pistacia vera TaxID=55513 RepID=UPI0012635249|nr:fasciclin-like arabinogalactan protein 21 [Pistacia vera]XP_031276461.1 fasciclin-like arabinogalactan protein 21 [Pistacia vera]